MDWFSESSLSWEEPYKGQCVVKGVQVCICVCQAVEDRGIHAGKVNCDAHQRLCQEAQVSAYPSVRFYAGTSTTRSTQVNTRSSLAFCQLPPRFYFIALTCYLQT